MTETAPTRRVVRSASSSAAGFSGAGPGALVAGPDGAGAALSGCAPAAGGYAETVLGGANDVEMAPAAHATAVPIRMMRRARRPRPFDASDASDASDAIDAIEADACDAAGSPEDEPVSDMTKSLRSYGVSGDPLTARCPRCSA
ncbi:hypothetical protein ACWEKM_22740 [Streptomyces sp. NPDC004752]